MIEQTEKKGALFARDIRVGTLYWEGCMRKSYCEDSIRVKFMAPLMAHKIVQRRSTLNKLSSCSSAHPRYNQRYFHTPRKCMKLLKEKFMQRFF